MAVGFLSGKIKIYLLNPKFEELGQYLDKQFEM